LLDWNGHINVAFCGKSYVVLYLYKYLFKGNKKIKIAFDNTDDLHDKDEINHYLRGRLICSMDAMWRCFGYQTYPATHPSITLIKVKLPDHLNAITVDGKMCDLEIYFRRPYCLKDLKYTEFFDLYDYGYNYPKKYLNMNGVNKNDIELIYNNVFNISDKCLDILKSSKSKNLYIYKRINSDRSITRMSMVYVYMGEIYYLRLLLLNVPTFGYDELLYYDNIKFTSFQLAAMARNLVLNEKLGYDCFKEAAQFSTAFERRNLFVLLTLQGYPTIKIYEDEELRFLLYEDYFYNSVEQSRELCNNKLLEELQIRFQQSDRTLTEFGLPNPKSIKTELERENLKYNLKEEWESFLLLNRIIVNNLEQQNVLNKVYSDIDKGKSKIYFLQGQAGSGKTTIAKKIIHYARSKNKIVLGCAATALAAQNYDGFDTFHGLFKYPVIEDMEDIDQIDHVTLNMDRYPDRKELIEESSVIIWDECPSNEYHCFKTVYEYFNKFKNKVIICLGDWRQTPPVVKYGSPTDIIKASIINSSMWSLFEVYKLRTNMRIFGIINNNQYNEDYIIKQKQYANMLMHIGEGTTDDNTVIKCDIPDEINNNVDNSIEDILENIRNDDSLNENIKNSKIGMIGVKIPILNYTKDISETIDFVFPNQFNNIDGLCDSAILCATNKSVNKWNEIIQSYNSEEENILKSYDSFDLVDDPKDILKNMLTPKVLNEYNANNVPPHELKLKVNDICFIMRNLHKKEGLTNNTRVRIVCIRKYTIRVCTINTKIPRFFEIPRIRFNVTLPWKSYKMCRLQYPLRLAYAMTYNKSQGQELNRCIVDITSPPFCHGHLYVALSRIRNCENIKLFYYDDSLIDDNDNIPIIRNYVYKELSIE